jgi:hypothetical protein
VALPEDEKGRGGGELAGLQVTRLRWRRRRGATVSRLWIERNHQLRLELMHRAELQRLERAAAVKKLSPSDLFRIHAAGFGGGSSRDAV